MNTNELIIAAKRHGIVIGTAELNQGRYWFALTLKWKYKKCITLDKKLCFLLPQGKKGCGFVQG